MQLKLREHVRQRVSDEKQNEIMRLAKRSNLSLPRSSRSPAKDNVPLSPNSDQAATARKNSYIQNYCRSGKVEKAEEVVERMRADGVPRDFLTYGFILNYHVSQNNAEKAEATFANMLRDGVQPNATSFNALLNLYIKSGNFDKAAKVLDEMAASGCQKNAATYGTLLPMYIAKGDATMVDEMLKELKENGIALDQNLLLHIIKAYANLNRYDQVDELLKKYDGKLAIGWKTYSEIFRTIATVKRKGWFSRATNIYETAKRHGELSLILGIWMVNACRFNLSVPPAVRAKMGLEYYEEVISLVKNASEDEKLRDAREECMKLLEVEKKEESKEEGKGEGKEMDKGE